jgi:hypothetical protein
MASFIWDVSLANMSAAGMVELMHYCRPPGLPAQSPTMVGERLAQAVITNFCGQS